MSYIRVIVSRHIASRTFFGSETFSTSRWPSALFRWAARGPGRAFHQHPRQLVFGQEAGLMRCTPSLSSLTGRDIPSTRPLTR
jgi:hypothetical protein